MILELLAGIGILKLFEKKPPRTKEELKADELKEKEYIISHCESSVSRCECDLNSIYVRIRKGDLDAKTN